MVAALAIGAATAFWLGLLTAISPCLLATNVAAVSFLARRVAHPRAVLVSCGCYMAGQAAAFVLIAALLVHGLAAVPAVAHLLQKYMFRLLGPFLLVCALLLLEWIALPAGRGRLKAWAQTRSRGGGRLAALILGAAFGMSFCPTTAALYFGAFLPLAVAQRSSMALPAAYAAGAALPVAAFSLLIAFAAHRLAAAFAETARAERLARRITALLFLALGLYLTFAHTFGLAGA